MGEVSLNYQVDDNICRQDGALTKENIAWLEKVFRENVGEGQEEFTLTEFKRIVPSKNVRTSRYKSGVILYKRIFRNSLWRGLFVFLTRMEAGQSPWRSSWRPCTSSPTRGRRRSSPSCSRCTTRMVSRIRINQQSEAFFCCII